MYLALNSNGFKESQPESLMNRNSHPVWSKNPSDPIPRSKPSRRQPLRLNPARSTAAHGEHDPSALLCLDPAANPAPSSSTQRKQPQHTGEPVGVHIATAPTPLSQSRPSHHRPLSTALPSNPKRTARPAVNWVLNS